MRTRRRPAHCESPQTPTNTVDRNSAAFRPITTWAEVDELTPNERNARTHTIKQINQIAASIGEFGFTNPVLVDAECCIVAGHGRVAAARLLGLDKVPTIRLDHLTEEQKRAYVIADNRLAELAGWDEELLALELQGLSELVLDFDTEITGFETAEIDLLIEGVEAAVAGGEDDDVPEPARDTPPVSAPGDLWLLTPHRLLCGDALDRSSYDRLLDGKLAQAVITDPPFNVRINGHVCGSGRIKHREFAMASGEMSEADFTTFLARSLSNLSERCVNGALLYSFIDWRHLRELLTASREVGLSLINLCVWNKPNAGLGSLYRSKHELVLVFKKGTAPHINTIELGRYGRYRSNVWDYEGVNTLRRRRREELALHPTVKPVALVADAIKDCTRRGAVVLDAFAGSGTTLLAAEKTGRIGYGLELDTRYVDIAVRRLERFTGRKALHAESGLTLEKVAEARGMSIASATREAESAGGGATGNVDHDV